jgi:hypothetical protein
MTIEKLQLFHCRECGKSFRVHAVVKLNYVREEVHQEDGTRERIKVTFTAFP